jgi:hypothetical protein
VYVRYIAAFYENAVVIYHNMLKDILFSFNFLCLALKKGVLQAVTQQIPVYKNKNTASTKKIELKSLVQFAYGDLSLLFCLLKMNL